MNCFIDPSKEWNQQKALQEISQQIAKEVDQFQLICKRNK